MAFFSSLFLLKATGRTALTTSEMLPLIHYQNKVFFMTTSLTLTSTIQWLSTHFHLILHTHTLAQIPSHTCQWCHASWYTHTHIIQPFIHIIGASGIFVANKSAYFWSNYLGGCTYVYMHVIETSNIFISKSTEIRC